MASSADGLKLAAVTYGGLIYTSSNGGTNWVAQTNSPAEDWVSIASSADGTVLAAAAGDVSAGVPGPLYTSTDSGATWTLNNLPLEGWTSITCSADGSKMAAASSSQTSSGVSDQIVTFTSSPQLWMSMSFDGTNISVNWPWPADNYQLEEKPTVSSPNWVPITNGITVTNYQYQLTLLPTGDEGVFRLSNTNGP